MPVAARRWRLCAIAVDLPKPAGARTSTSFTAARAISSLSDGRSTWAATKAGGLSLASTIRGRVGDIAGKVG